MANEVHLLFAGGIHDACSAAGVAAMAAPLAERGVKVGVLVGTAYLFTDEAVATGAIVPAFQDEAVRCASTVLLETGPGHEVRVSPTPYADRFESERRRLIDEGRSADEIREALERLNAGRLRLAAKGVDRSGGPGRRWNTVDEPRPEEPRALHARAGGHASRPGHHDFRRPPRDQRRQRRMDRTRDGRERGRGRAVGRHTGPARRDRDHRHVGDRPGRRRRADLLGEHPPRSRRDHGGARRTLGLATLLRRRPQGSRQDHLEVGRVHPGRAV